MKIFIAFIFTLYHTIAAAEGNLLHEHALRTGLFESEIANLGPGCRIKVDIPKWSKLNQRYQTKEHRGAAGLSFEMPPHFSNSGRWGIDFSCFQTKDEEFKKFWADRSAKEGVNFKIKSGKKTFTDEEGSKFTSIQAINAKGWAVTFDDTAGDERYRTRHLWYCLKNSTNAICGNSDIGYIDYLENNKNIDMQSVTLKILESIEFLEDAPPNQ